MEKDKNGLEIEQDLKHQKNAWRFQQIGMAFLLIVFILSLLGFLGNGPLSSSSTGSSNGKFKVEFEKIARMNSPVTTYITVNKDLLVNDTLTVLISKSFTKAVEINDIIPAPVEQTDAGDNIEFSFLTKEAVNYSHIRINYKFRRYGFEEYSILINDEQVFINQFILP
jgi:hypothetical protein